MFFCDQCIWVSHNKHNADVHLNIIQWYWRWRQYVSTKTRCRLL